MANNIANQTKNAQVNSFTGGINTDLHPMLQPNNTLTDCVNGTLITYNGNENMLQNDMGNYALEGAKLPLNYVPIGVKEHAGILYVVACNPYTKKVQIGSYPSPKVQGLPGENTTKVELNTFSIPECNDSNLFDAFTELENSESDYLYSNIATSANQTMSLFGNFDQKQFQLTLTDEYKIIIDIDKNNSQDWLQELKYFSVCPDGTIQDISDNIKLGDDFVNVGWQSSGWLGIKYELPSVSKSSQYISNVSFPTYRRATKSIWEIEDNTSFGKFSNKIKLFDDPFIMIENATGSYNKYYWEKEFGNNDKTVRYYTLGEWKIKDSDNSVEEHDVIDGWHTVVFKNQVVNISDLFEIYDSSKPLYLFLPVNAFIDESENSIFKNTNVSVFIQNNSTQTFHINANLEFINIVAGITGKFEGSISELYCPKYNSNIKLNPSKVQTFVGSFDDIRDAFRFPNVVCDEIGSRMQKTIKYTSTTKSVIELDYENIKSNSYDEFGLIEFRDPIFKIPKGMFSNSEFESITLPTSVTDIEDDAFHQDIEIILGSRRINSMLSGKLFKKVTLGKEVEFIADGAFTNCGGELHINSKLVETDNTNNSIFANSKFSKITIGENITKIGSNWFKGITSINKIEISDSVKEISSNAFADCTNLQSVRLPAFCDKLDCSAFDGCTKFSETKYEGTIPPELDGVFKTELNVKVSNAVLDSFKEKWSDKNVCITSDILIEVCFDQTPDGNVAIKLSYSNGNSTEENMFAFPINPNMYRMSTTTSEQIVSIEIINTERISNATIPPGIEFIHNINYAVNYSNVYELFKNPCGSIHPILLNGADIVDLKIPNGIQDMQVVSQIKTLNSVVIPKSVDSIPSNIFANCTKLSRIEYYGETDIDWNSVGRSSFLDLYLTPEQLVKNINTKIGVTIKPLYTRAFITGRGDQWSTEDDWMRLDFEHNKLKYVFPQSWKYKKNFIGDVYTYNYNDKNSGSTTLLETPYKYCYSVINSCSYDSIKTWVIMNNTVTIHKLEECDPNIEFKFEYIDLLNYWNLYNTRPFASTGDLEKTSTGIIWGEESSEVYTGDSMSFNVNAQMILPQNIWKKYIEQDTIEFKCAIRFTGFDINNEQYQYKISKNIEEIESSKNFYTLDVSHHFEDLIPDNFDKMRIDSVFYCEEKNGNRKLVLDQTYCQDMLIIPGLQVLDSSKSQVVTFKYGVELNDNDKSHNLQLDFTFSSIVDLMFVYCKISSSDGKYTYFGYPTNNFISDQCHIEINDCNKYVQFAKVELFVDDRLTFDKTIMLHTIINDESNRRYSNMGLLPWENLLKDVVEDAQKTESRKYSDWDLNIKIETENYHIKQCKYDKTSGSILEYEEVAFPKDILPYVNENGYLLKYNNLTFANAVHANTKTNIYLGDCLKISGNIYQIDSMYNNGTKKSSIVNYNLGTKYEHFMPFGFYEIEFEKGAESLVTATERYSEYLCKPIELESWISEFSELDKERIRSHWKKNQGLLIGSEHSKDEVSKAYAELATDLKNESRGSRNYSWNQIQDHLPVIFPIKYKDNRYGVYSSIYLKTYDKEIAEEELWHSSSLDRTYHISDGSLMQNTILSCGDTKPVNWYTFGIKTTDGKDTIFRYPWVSTHALMTREELLKYEKLLFIYSFFLNRERSISSGTLNVYSISSKDVNQVSINKCLIRAKNCDIRIPNGTKYSIGSISIQGEISNIDFGEHDVLNNFNEFNKQQYILSNNPLEDLLKNDSWGDPISYYLSEDSLINNTFSSSRKTVNIGPIEMINPPMWVSYWWTDFDTKGVKRYVKSSLNFASAFDLRPCDPREESSGIFNQIYKPLAQNNCMTLTINGQTETKTIDEWIQYCLEILLKEIKLREKWQE